MSLEADSRPLADRVRPVRLDQFVGQRHLLGEGKPLQLMCAAGRLHSMILWGPPGTGKTTLARLLAAQAEVHFISLSAVLSGVKEVRDAVQAAQQHQQYGESTLLFVDEVHRFNKAQQDAFLPHVENGTITVIGATTENPSFEVNAALLSRARVYVLNPLNDDELAEILVSAAASDLSLAIDDQALDYLAELADGDARRGLNLLDIAAQRVTDGTVTFDQVKAVAGSRYRRFDKQGDSFYDQISALHKSIRGSDPDAALYWFVRMLDGGCDPLYLARRLLRMASEDVGNADPRALQLALDGWQTFERLGSPEGELALAQVVIYLASVPKSNSVYTAMAAAKAAVTKSGSLPVPEHLRNAPTALQKELGHGENYRYAHDETDAYAPGENYFPTGLAERNFYEPSQRGLEAKISARLARLRAADADYQNRAHKNLKDEVIK